ncbi:MAG: hypothetical protein RR022_03395 [Angelakisella sp.]
MPQNRQSQSFRDICTRYARLSAENRQLDEDLAYLRHKLGALAAEEHRQPLLVQKTEQRLGQLLSRSSLVWNELVETETLLRRAAACLPQPRMTRILLYRYLEQLPWSQISEITGLEPRWLYRLHRRALALLDARQRSA